MSNPLPDFEYEMATTRRMLERVPDDNGAWKPHEKSFPLGHLAQLVARMPGWIAQTLAEDSAELGSFPAYSYEKTPTLLAEFDRNVAAARAALASATEAQLAGTWSMLLRGQTVFSAQRGATIRTHLNHLVHHRGQLSVYLRLLEVPVPSIYGPSADERG